MASSVKKGMLKMPRDKKLVPKHRPLRPWEKKVPSQNIPKCVLDEQMRKMTLQQLSDLSLVGRKVD